MRNWLKEIRVNEGMTCKQVADECGFTPEFFTMIEQGIRRPSPESAKKLEIALNFKKYGIDWTRFF